MNILLAGNWNSKIHEEPLKKSFEELGYQVSSFKWFKYFKSKSFFYSKVLQIQKKFFCSPIISKINKDFLLQVFDEQPDIIFLYRSNLIYEKTIKKIKLEQKNTKIIIYNNDSPFSKKYKPSYWKNFIKLIKHSDIIFSYRPSDISGYEKNGGKNIYLLLPWYIKSKNYRVELSNDDKINFTNDIIFIGHYEDDGRLDLFKEVIKRNFKLKIYGPEWNKIIKNDKIMKKQFPVKYLNGNDYNKALSGAKIAIAIYSQLNNDVYTRKCFEIPATQTFMIAKRSFEMERLFEENKEVVFFDTVDELCEKLEYFLKNKKIRESIAKNGYDKVVNYKHEVKERSKYIIEIINKHKT